MAHGYVTPTGGFTVETWFWRDTAPTAYEALWGQVTQAPAAWSTSSSLNGRHMWFGLSSSGFLHLSFYTEDGTNRLTWTDVIGNDYRNDSTWHHAAVRLDTAKTSWVVYLDGLVYAAGTMGAAMDWNPGVFAFGAAHYAPHLGQFGSYIWNGRLAYSAITDYAITDNRVWEHYAAGNGGAVFYGDNEVTRMNRLLDWAEVPTQSRVLDSSLVTLQGIAVADTNVLDELQASGEWATGYVFADGQSRFVYHNRRRRYNRPVAAVFAESTGSAIEAGIEFATDDTFVYNDVRGDRPYGSTVRAEDDLSRAEYGRKTYSFSISVTSAEELRNAVGWILARYGSDRVRVQAVTVRAESSTLIEQWVTSLDVGDHIAFDELPPHAPASYMEFTIEGIALDADFKDKVYAVRYSLSPAELDRVFEVGVSTLGSGDRLAF